MINQLAIKKYCFLRYSFFKIYWKRWKTHNDLSWELVWEDVGARGCHSRPQRPSFPGHVVLLQIEPSDWAWEWGVVEWHLHYSMRGMWQTISRLGSLRQRKWRENAYIKSLVLTVQASCCWIQTIEVSCLYFSTCLILILFSLLNYFFGPLPQVCCLLKLIQVWNWNSFL